MNSGSKILLTGVTGFVGKVVLEELIRRSNELNIESVYVLIREKNNKRTGEQMSAAERFEKEVASSQCFSKLPSQWKQFVKVVSGDLTIKSFNLDEKVKNELNTELTQIINCAASVEFDLPVADAAASNITSALNVLEFARECSKLDIFVNVSTAYVSPHPGEGIPVPEKLVNLPFDPEVIYQSILDGTADEKALMKQTGHPNTYTLTKCISEHLLAKRKGNIPLAIVRPSIISASWKYPNPGWIDSYAAFAGFVSLIGLGMLKCVKADENTVLDIVPCDDVAQRVIDTAFWKEDYQRPFIQHVVSGIDRGCRVDTCMYGMENYFQKNPVQQWARVKQVSNGKSIEAGHIMHHVLPSKVADTWFALSGQEKQRRQMKKVQEKIEYLNKAFPYFTHNSFNFEMSKPLSMPFDQKHYIELVCRGVYENLMKRDESETLFAGTKHKHPKSDLTWVNQQPEGNWAIRTAAYVVRKGLRKCTEWISFDRKSFEDATSHFAPESLIVIVPNHRSYMDFILCSYLFFAHPELNIQIPQIAAANDFAKIPFLGWFFQQTYAFYIKRGEGKEDPELKHKIQALVDENKTLEFFIEGTRSRSRQFLKPKRGLLRSLQNTGIPCTILPISISYDLVPEEKAFLKELKAISKSKMKLSSLLKWTNHMLADKIHLGRVHIVCGTPVKMTENSDVHSISKKIMYELQDKTVVSTFHLKSFLHHTKNSGIELDWLKNEIIKREGTVIDSPLNGTENIDPISEKTMRFHWMHYFYPDIHELKKDNPAIEYHVKHNFYSHPSLHKEASRFAKSEKSDKQLSNLLKEVFEPITKEYTRLLEVASKNKGNLPDIDTLVAQSEDSFMPFVEEAISAFIDYGLIKKNDSGNGYSAGAKWFDRNSFYEKCQWDKEKIPEAKLA